VFGFTNPILIDSKNRVVAGHGRLEAAKLLGWIEIPTICLENLTEEQIRAYVIADNKLAENAGWDRSILAVELQHLLTLDCTDFDVTITGFEISEIDLIQEDAAGPMAEDETYSSRFRTKSRSPNRAICGSWGSIGSSVATRSRKTAINP
jgi:hypothetical protein